MGRHPAMIDPATPGRVLAEYLRKVITDAGLTHAQVADSARVQKSTMSARLDGRSVGWNVVEKTVDAIQAAAKAAGCVHVLPVELLDEARSKWRPAIRDSNVQPPKDAGKAPGEATVQREADAATAQRLALELPPLITASDPEPLETLFAAMLAVVQARGIDLQEPTSVPPNGPLILSRELFEGIVTRRWPITRTFVIAIIAATGLNPMRWEQAYAQAHTYMMLRATVTRLVWESRRLTDRTVASAPPVAAVHADEMDRASTSRLRSVPPAPAQRAYAEAGPGQLIDIRARRSGYRRSQAG